MRRLGMISSNLIWIVSIALILEAPLRSSGSFLILPQIGLGPGLWLSDLGLMLPIVIAGFASGLWLTKDKLWLLIISAALYGVILGIVNGNTAQFIVADIRIMISLLSGYSLVRIMPKTLWAFTVHLTVLSTFVLLACSYSTVLSSGMDVVVNMERVTNAPFYLMVAVIVPLLASLDIIVWLSRASYLKWYVALLNVVFLFLALSVTQTRSLAIGVGVAIVAALLSIRRFSLVSNSKYHNIIRFRGMVMIAISLIFFLYVMSVENPMTEYAGRLFGQMNYQRESSTLERIKEAVETFSNMEVVDLIVGKGFGPAGVYFNSRDESVMGLHIGILNVLWRCGAIWFAYYVGYVLVAIFRYLKALWGATRRNGAIANRDVAIIICVPGLATAFVGSLLSGGWSISSFLPMGILFGIYRALCFRTEINPFRSKH